MGSLVAGLSLAQQTASPATTTVDIEELASRSVHGLVVPNHDKLITGVSHPTGIFDCLTKLTNPLSGIFQRLPVVDGL